MSGDNRELTDAALDDIAAEWLCERMDGFAGTRVQDFAAWCAADPRHAAAIARVEAAMALLDEMPAARASLEARFGPTDDWRARPPRRRNAIVRHGWTVGIAAVLVLTISGWWGLAGKSRRGGEAEGATQIFTSDASGPRRIALRDGSVVDLNAGSELRVDFVPNERRVKLAAGEALFAVAKDAGRPFVVTAGDVRVRAIGTAFNVRLAAREVDVLVVEGKIEIARHDVPSAAVPQLSAGERTVMLRELPLAAPPIEKVPPTSMRELLAWQDRMTQFVDVPLREIAERFNRRNTLQLVIGDAALAERKIGGVIAWDQVEAFVRLLEQEGDIVAERRGSSEIVLRRAR